MESLVISKENFPEIINTIILSYRLFAPTEENGFSVFNIIKDYSEMDLSYLNSRMPPKALLFNQTETLFLMEPGAKGTIKPKEIRNEKTAIFAIRPCDAKGFRILDPVFLGDVVDPLYKANRDNSVLIGLSCNQPDSSCFCTSFGDSPASGKYVDILFTDIGENCLVEVITEKGKGFVNDFSRFFSPASSEEIKAKNVKEKEAIKSIKRNLKIEGIEEKMDKMFNHPIWEEYAKKCIGCGTCTYLCPTCHCFDMQDEATLDKGARIRVWDACMFPEYTMHTSGHNPRPARMHRVRNRFYHKYSYFPKNSDVIACTGCGRCIRYCPVNIDIIELMNRVSEMEL
ncbi:MAG: 4Fe-4S dicluster domain-containing protein [Candidatus Heimdallarchaeota archaeon]|nr:4Fe-4S dicluster domain-containing protein [Candidatus Heimdallarchaeota archaeon]